MTSPLHELWRAQPASASGTLSATPRPGLLRVRRKGSVRPPDRGMSAPELDGRCTGLAIERGDRRDGRDARTELTREQRRHPTPT